MNQPHKKSSSSEFPIKTVWGGGGGGGGGGGHGPHILHIIIEWPRAKARRGAIFNIIVWMGKYWAVYYFYL